MNETLPAHGCREPASHNRQGTSFRVVLLCCILFVCTLVAVGVEDVVEPIQKAYNEGDIDQAEYLALKALQHPDLKDIRIILGGHTDAKGSDGFNQILSQKRSDSVARLVAQIGGIDESLLVPVGFGEHQLKNIHDPHAAENRRVEVINISGY